MDNPLVIEWCEARKTIARFDGYLLRLRILAFSSFTILFVAAAGITKTKLEDLIVLELILIALALLYFYISVIFILDRYYERMLMIAVNRASRLEAARLDDFKIGLTTEIERGKNGGKGSTLNERISFFLSSTGRMVVFIYAFVFLIILISLTLIIFKTETYFFLSKKYYIAILILLAIFGIFLMNFSFNIMKRPLLEADIRSDVANSPEILTNTDILNCIKNIAQKIELWLENEKKISYLNVICILNGARQFTYDLVIELEKKNILCKISYIKVRATNGMNLLDSIEIDSDNIDKAINENEIALIVDDLVDSGRTLEIVKHYLVSLGYKNLKTAALLNKYDNAVTADFIGFNLKLNKAKMNEIGIEDYWIFGYGMDIYGHYRDIRYIGWIKKFL